MIEAVNINNLVKHLKDREKSSVFRLSNQEIYNRKQIRLIKGWGITIKISKEMTLHPVETGRKIAFHNG